METEIFEFLKNTIKEYSDYVKTEDHEREEGFKRKNFRKENMFQKKR